LIISQLFSPFLSFINVNAQDIVDENVVNIQRSSNDNGWISNHQMAVEANQHINLSIDTDSESLDSIEVIQSNGQMETLSITKDKDFFDQTVDAFTLWQAEWDQYEKDKVIYESVVRENDQKHAAYQEELKIYQDKLAEFESQLAKHEQMVQEKLDKQKTEQQAESSQPDIEEESIPTVSPSPGEPPVKPTEPVLSEEKEPTEPKEFTNKQWQIAYANPDQGTYHIFIPEEVNIQRINWLTSSKNKNSSHKATISTDFKLDGQNYHYIWNESVDHDQKEEPVSGQDEVTNESSELTSSSEKGMATNSEEGETSDSVVDDKEQQTTVKLDLKDDIKIIQGADLLPIDFIEKPEELPSDVKIVLEEEPNTKKIGSFNNVLKVIQANNTMTSFPVTYEVIAPPRLMPRIARNSAMNLMQVNQTGNFPVLARDQFGNPVIGAQIGLRHYIYDYYDGGALQTQYSLKLVDAKPTMSNGLARLQTEDGGLIEYYVELFSTPTGYRPVQKQQLRMSLATTRFDQSYVGEYYGPYRMSNSGIIDTWIAGSAPVIPNGKPNSNGQVDIRIEKLVSNVSFLATDRETGQSLSGIQYQITRDTPDPIFPQNSITATSDASGRVTFPDIPYGSYTIREIKTRDGYILNNQPIKVNVQVDSSGTAVQSNLSPGYRHPNTRFNTNLTLNKINEDGEPLSQGKFTLREVNTRINYSGYSQSAVSDGNGQLVFSNIQSGTYELIETTPPPGYKPMQKPIRFYVNVVNNRLVISLADPNTPNITGSQNNFTLINQAFVTNVPVKVVEAETGTPLIDSAFELYRRTASGNWQLIDSKQTGSTNTFELSNLRVGSYRIVETKASPGYELFTQPLIFDIVPDTSGVQIRNTSNTQLMSSAPSTGVLTIYNQQRAVLPATGGTGILAYLFIGMTLILTALYLYRKNVVNLNGGDE
jgi:LPXTG-motif cell wall-anchored protein